MTEGPTGRQPPLEVCRAKAIIPPHPCEVTGGIYSFFYIEFNLSCSLGRLVQMTPRCFTHQQFDFRSQMREFTKNKTKVLSKSDSDMTSLFSYVHPRRPADLIPNPRRSFDRPCSTFFFVRVFHLNEMSTCVINEGCFV